MMEVTPDFKLKIVVIDDEQPARQAIAAILTELRPDCSLVGEAANVSAGVKLIRQTHPDIVLLDVSMPDGTGFDLLEMFPNFKFRIIFTTAHDDFAVKAFRYNAIDYLLKPILPRELIESLDRVSVEPSNLHTQKVLGLSKDAKNRQLSRIVLPSHEGLIFLRLEQVVRLEADGNYTTFFIINGFNTNLERHTVAQPLREFEEMLSQDLFFRVHQSHLVNFNFIKKFVKKDGGYVSMEDGSLLPIARRRKEDFMNWLLSRGGG